MLFGAPVVGYALGEPRYVSNKPDAGAFALVDHQAAVPLLVSNDDWPGVVRAAGDLSADIDRVAGLQPALFHAAADVHNPDAVLIGTIGRSALIDDLVRRHKLDVSGIAGKWETAVTTIVEHPMPGVRRALVIAGSDKRGTIFAIYDLSEQIGVSPWTWWADVPVDHKDALYVRSHYDGMTITLPPDAPAADEIALIICLANRGRLNARVGGLAAKDVVGKDGLR